LIHSTLSSSEAWLLKVSKYTHKMFERTDHSSKLYLKQKKNFNILFIQKPPWFIIWTIPSSFNKERDIVINISNYSNWTTFPRLDTNNHDHLRVVTYINICLMTIHFSLRRDILNHKNICCFSFFNSSSIFSMINIYSDDNHSALKYLKNIEVNIQNVLIMVDNFNIRDSD